MASLDGNRWGSAIKVAIDGLTIPQDRVITDGELESFWQAITSEHVSEVTTNAEVSSDGATGTGPKGGPLPITALPGTVS